MAWTEWNQRSAYLLVKSDWKAGEAVWRKAQEWPETIGTWMVTGNWGVVAWVDAHSWEDLYDRVVAVRGISGVTATSSHFVYKGMKNGKWWWEWPVGAWVFLRSPHLNGEMKNFNKWKGATSIASLPGDWDYLMWAGAHGWDQVWGEVAALNKAGWCTETMVPMRTWWNKSWKKNWWTENKECACCG